jgi:hypothetical protein
MLYHVRYYTLIHKNFDSSLRPLWSLHQHEEALHDEAILNRCVQSCLQKVTPGLQATITYVRVPSDVESGHASEPAHHGPRARGCCPHTSSLRTQSSTDKYFGGPKPDNYKEASFSLNSICILPTYLNRIPG